MILALHYEYNVASVFSQVMHLINFIILLSVWALKTIKMGYLNENLNFKP